MTIRQAGEAIERGAEICLTLKWGYLPSGFANVTSIIFKKTRDFTEQGFASRVEYYRKTAEDFVLCEA